MNATKLPAFRTTGQQFEELDTINTEVIWPDVSYREDEPIDGFRTWRVDYKDGSYPASCIGVITEEKSGGISYFVGATDKGERNCLTVKDAVMFCILSYAGDWRQVSLGDVAAPIPRVYVP